MDLEFAWLRAFVAVAEELHFGRAALRLGISQPQVSRQVRALEASVGIELFVRTARRTELTDAGAALLGDARETLAAAERLRTGAAAHRRAARGHVSVAFLWSTLGGYLAPLVSAAAELLPEVELTVSQIAFVELLPALRRGDVDMAITRPLFEQTEMTELVLREEQAMIAINADHPFAQDEAIELSRLGGEPLISLRRELVPAAYDALLDRGRDRGIDLQIAHHVRSAAEALALVSAGLGLYRLPESAAAPFPGVLYRPISDSRSKLVLVYRPFPRRPAERVIELAVDLFGDA